MTIRVSKFRVRRTAPAQSGARTSGSDASADVRAADAAAPPAANTPTPDAQGSRGRAESDAAAPGQAAAETGRAVAEWQPPGEPAAAGPGGEIDAIRREGLTGRQLRMARRVAQKHGIGVTSDHDAVRQLRARGIDPFQRSTVLELVVPDRAARGTLPATREAPPPPSTETRPPGAAAMAEVMEIRRDLVRRRRRRFALLIARLAFFVGLPTLLAGYYYFEMATPMYATKSEFVIQQAEQQGAAGLGGLFQGTSMATQQDSITVQSYLASRAAMTRLDAEHGFKEHFSQPWIDPIQRLPPDASNEEAFSVYSDRVKVSYDPTEGILKMEVAAADPRTSQRFSEALIGYAEDQVDHLTQRLREDQMAGAREAYQAAETRRAEALQNWLTIQQDLEVLDPVGETAAVTQQIAALETQRQDLQLELQNRLNVRRPNEAQVAALRSQIGNIEGLIGELRVQMTAAGEAGGSLASKNTELRLAEENYTFQTLLTQQALQQMETARIEANRQVRYLSLGVVPMAPDDPSYPRAFENTVLAFLIFSGIYLMVSITGSILREQVTG